MLLNFPDTKSLKNIYVPVSTETMTQFSVYSDYLSQKNVKTVEKSKVELVFMEYFWQKCSVHV
jgi:hypothetical protein